ncbi:hypothetical protein D3C87_17640 [compost metagenome]
MKVIGKAAFLVGLAFLLNGCGRMSNPEIMKSWWKFGRGSSIGDVLIFDKTNLKADTIYQNGEPVALIIDCNKGVFRRSAVLEIELLTTHAHGFYHDKGLR